MRGVLAGTASLLSRAAEMSANALARSWLLELCGPRRWHDTHESMFARAGKLAALSPRRVRAIVNGERHVKVSGDELLAIQRARESLAEMEALASTANALARRAAESQGSQPLHKGGRDTGDGVK